MMVAIGIVGSQLEEYMAVLVILYNINWKR